MAPSSRGGPIPRANQHSKSRWRMELLPQLPGLHGQVGGSSNPSCKLTALGRGPAASHQLPRGGERAHAGVRGVCWDGLVFSPALASERGAATSKRKEMSKRSETGPRKYVSRGSRKRSARPTSHRPQPPAGSSASRSVAHRSPHPPWKRQHSLGSDAKLCVWVWAQDSLSLFLPQLYHFSN